jgi:hypothetical protein
LISLENIVDKIERLKLLRARQSINSQVWSFDRDSSEFAEGHKYEKQRIQHTAHNRNHFTVYSLVIGLLSTRDGHVY